MPPKRKMVAKKKSQTRKLRVVGEKVTKNRTLNAARTTSANTTKRRAAAWKVAATAKLQTSDAQTPPSATGAQTVAPEVPPRAMGRT